MRPTNIVRRNIDEGADIIKLFTGSNVSPARVLPMPDDVAVAGGQILFGTDVGYLTHSDPSREYEFDGPRRADLARDPRKPDHEPSSAISRSVTSRTSRPRTGRRPRRPAQGSSRRRAGVGRCPFHHSRRSSLLLNQGRPATFGAREATESLLRGALRS